MNVNLSDYFCVDLNEGDVITISLLAKREGIRARDATAQIIASLQTDFVDGIMGNNGYTLKCISCDFGSVKDADDEMMVEKKFKVVAKHGDHNNS